ncbi:MAG: DNA polymerase III subunit delta [bacterium]|nr:DNA polymerase III subunit delta [bacterium]
MKIDYQILFRKLKKGEIAPLYLFAGAEEYLIDEGIRLIKEKLITKGDEELNYDMMYGFEASIQTILEKVETAGFFGDKRLVVVQGVNSIKDKKLLVSYCENPSRSSCLVLIDEKIDSKNKLQSIFLTSKDAVISHFWPLFPNQVPSWIQEKTKQKGKLISHECAQILQELAGNSLRSLDNEIEKLVIFVGDRKTIEEKDVLELISSGDIENIFKLSDAIGERRLDKALKIFNQLKNKGDDFIAVLGLLIRHFRIIWQVKEMNEEGVSPLEISKIIKMNPTFVTKYLQEMKNFTWDGLKNIFKRMLQADYEIKRGISKPEIAFESLLISFSK